MRNLRAAATKAEHWLSADQPREHDDALRELGLWLCRRIQRPPGDAAGVASSDIALPAPSALVEMDRENLLALARAVTLSNRPTCRAAMHPRETWARVLGGLALSYARDGDVAVVAALVRTAAHVEIEGTWLTEALGHLLDQQQADGSFGLLAPELAVANDPGCEPQVARRLTVEVLWALAEVAAARRRLTKNAKVAKDAKQESTYDPMRP